jgi:hypothetical protein
MTSFSWVPPPFVATDSNGSVAMADKTWGRFNKATFRASTSGQIYKWTFTRELLISLFHGTKNKTPLKKTFSYMYRYIYWSNISSPKIQTKLIHTYVLKPWPNGINEIRSLFSAYISHLLFWSKIDVIGKTSANINVGCLI